MKKPGFRKKGPTAAEGFYKVEPLMLQSLEPAKPVAGIFTCGKLFFWSQALSRPDEQENQRCR